MNTEHLATLTTALTELRAARDRVNAVADTLQQLYDDQPGAWRWTTVQAIQDEQRSLQMENRTLLNRLDLLRTEMNERLDALIKKLT